MIALFLAIVLPAACHVIHSDVIAGRDLAEAVPVFASLPPDLNLGLAPVPGRQRTFSIADLKRIASTHSIQVDVDDKVCFEWELALPARDEMISSMQKAFPNRNVHIEIQEQSLAAAPKGDIVFPPEGLGMGPEKSVIWRGYVQYAGTRRFSIWARVAIKVTEQRVTSVIELHPGDSIREGQLKTVGYEGPLYREMYVVDPKQIAGMLVRRSIPAGSPLQEDMLEPPLDVERGEVVNAIVENGNAKLILQGVAENAGRRGQVINVRNPRSGRLFRARVEEKGIVLVVPGGQYGLVPEPKKS